MNNTEIDRSEELGHTALIILVSLLGITFLLAIAGGIFLIIHGNTCENSAADIELEEI